MVVNRYFFSRSKAALPYAVARDTGRDASRSSPDQPESVSTGGIKPHTYENL